MDTKDFRRHAHAFVDWMADYLAEVERYPVRAQVKPAEAAAKPPLAPPQRGALLTARERATGWRANEEGVGAVGPLRVYCSTETHSATEKGVKIAGLGRANVRKVPVDARFAMRPDALEAAIREDLAAGATPVCVVASLGTTGVGALDPLRPIGEGCRRHNGWLPGDGAVAGSAR